MLIRQTVRYLPAQLIGPLAQFAALVAWTHMLPPSDYGFVALVFATQDLAYLVCLSWWSQYILRYLPVLPRDGAELGAEVSILLVSAALQIPFAVCCLVWTGHATEGVLGLSTMVFTLGRSLATYLGERARAEGSITVYTVAQTGGPVFGLLIGLLLMRILPGPTAIIVGFAVVQIAILPWMAVRLGLRWRLRGDLLTLRPALRYGFPLLAAGACGWLSINGIRLIVEQRGGLVDVGLVSVGWNLAQRLIAVVAMLVTAAAFPLAVRMLATEGRKQSIAQISRNGALFIGLLLPATVGLIAIAPTLTLTLVGPEFHAATLVVLPLATLAAAVRNLRVHFADQVFLIIEQPGMALTINACEAVGTVVLCAIGLSLGGLPGACLGCLIAQIACAFLCFGIAMVKHGLEIPLDTVGRFAAATLLMGMALRLVVVPPTLFGLGVEIVIGAFVYLVVLAFLFRGVWLTIFAPPA